MCAYGSQKAVLVPLELKLQATVNYCEIQPRSPGRAAGALELLSHLSSLIFYYFK